MRLSRLTLFFGLFIVVSASFMRQIFELFYNNIGKERTETIFGICFILIFAIVAWRLVLKPINIKRKLLFLAIFALGLSLSWQLKILVERVHVLEYGLLGVLAAKDLLKKSISIKPISLIIIAVTILAFLDEGLQYILPYRCWDLRDIAFNLSGGIWGILLFSTSQQHKK